MSYGVTETCAAAAATGCWYTRKKENISEMCISVLFCRCWMFLGLTCLVAAVFTTDLGSWWLFTNDWSYWRLCLLLQRLVLFPGFDGWFYFLDTTAHFVSRMQRPIPFPGDRKYSPMLAPSGSDSLLFYCWLWLLIICFLHLTNDYFCKRIISSLTFSDSDDGLLLLDTVDIC